jgi:N-acetylglucosamine kinase
MARYFGGIQGGGSHSDCVILNERGEQVGSSSGPGTNPWGLGFDRAVEELATMVKKAKTDAGIPQDKPLDSLGMALSGGEQAEAQRRIAEGITSKHPNTASLYHVSTDTFGSIATAFPKGGMVLISGTGSNCQLLNPSGSAPRCGGWGHMLGDGGSGYWISHRTIQMVYDGEDGLVTPAHDYTAVKNLVFQHFKLEKRYDILDHLYEKFEKSHIATLCKPLAELARKGDKLARQVFWDAGEILGAHVKALVPQAEEPFSKTPGGLRIVAVGSVLAHCWDLLREGGGERRSHN